MPSAPCARPSTVFGGLDILVQNAGIYPWTLIENISPEEWDKVLAVNLKGTFLAARAALPHMKPKRSGRMIFTSSITGPRVTSPGHGHYSASKAGINGFIKAAALEFSSYGITVNGIEPGNILTSGMKMHRSGGLHQVRWKRPCRWAASARRATSPTCALFLASDEACLHHRHDHHRRWRTDAARGQGLPHHAGRSGETSLQAVSGRSAPVIAGQRFRCSIAICRARGLAFGGPF